MNVDIIQAQPIHVAMLRHYGPYELISPVFDQLWSWVTSQGVPAQRTIGIYWDNPDYTPSNRLRSAACVELPNGYMVGDRGGLAIEDTFIAGGPYATTTFVGPYEDLAPVWSDFTAYIERRLRRAISSNPAFEVYVNDASTTPPSQLITQLYMPLVR